VTDFRRAEPGSGGASAPVSGTAGAELTSATPGPPSGRPSGRTARRRLPLLILMVLAAGFLALGLAEAHSDAPTYDEPVYVSAGLAAILHQDVTYNDEHPPLPKVLAALPVLFTHPVIPPNGAWSGNDEHAYAASFTSAQLSAGDLQPVTFASRLVPLAETAGVAFVLFALALELFGPELGALAGLLAGALWLASPFVLGIGHLDGVDVPFTLAIALSCWALVRWLHRRALRALGWLGLTFAAVAGTQISGLLVVASGLAVVLVAQLLALGRPGAVKALAHTVLAGLICVAGLWLSYLVVDPSVITHVTLGLPHPYVDGAHYLKSQDTIGAAGYVAGVAYQGGRWWFWPVSLVIKWPLASLLLLVAGLVACCWLPRPVRRRAVWGVALPAVLLAGFDLIMPRDIGLRYLLPSLALAAVLAGALVPVAARWGSRAWSVSRAGIVVLVALAAVATVTSFPQSLSWTTWPFRPAYTAVTDSNVDWGQGLYQLSAWSKSHHPYVLYFGPRGVSTAAIPGSRPLPADPAQHVTGWVAVSATALNSSNRAQLSWLRPWCPVRVLAGSILIYRFRGSPGLPAGAVPSSVPGLCSGRWSSEA
jgi:4-amino-4-deoxy-L-arabinose transferase-like glycosyltransferase